MPALSVLVLTEDGGEGAPEAAQHAVRQGLLAVDPDTDTGPDRLEWVPATDAQAAAMRANGWKSRHPRDERRRRDLVRSIATKLLEEGVPGFVVFHYDGDCAWSAQACPHHAPFDALVRRPVRSLLTVGREPSDEALDALLGRLHTMVPHYSLEAWAWQNLEGVRAVCLEAGREDLVGQLEAWGQERAALDEVVKVKEALPPVRDRHNVALLASGWPRQEVYASGASFCAFVDRLRDDEALGAALRRTWDRWSTP